jgi:hypothetical protein
MRLLVLVLAFLLLLALAPVGDFRRSWFIWAAAVPVLAVLSTNSNRLPGWMYTWTGARYLYAGTLLLAVLSYALVKWLSG